MRQGWKKGRTFRARCPECGDTMESGSAIGLTSKMRAHVKQYGNPTLGIFFALTVTGTFFVKGDTA